MDYTEKALRLDKINVTDYNMSNFGWLVATFLLTHFISLSVEDAQETLTHMIEPERNPGPSTRVIPRADMQVNRQYFLEVYGKAVETAQLFMHGLTVGMYGDTQGTIDEMRGMAAFMAGKENRRRAEACIPELYDFLYDCYLEVVR